MFYGITPKECRDVLSKFIIERNIKMCVFPCVGAFTDVITAIQSGIKPEHVVTGDISLYSTVLGYTFSGLKIKDIGVKFNDDKLKSLDPSNAEDILLAIKICQLSKSKDYFTNEYLREILNNKEIYKKKIKKNLLELDKILHGLHYGCRDLFQTIYDFQKDDKTTLLYIDPPIYKQGYSKMFDFQGSITWAEPNIKEFDPALFFDLMYELRNKKPSIIMFYNNPDTNDETYGKGVKFMNKLFAKQMTETRMIYLLTNKSIKPDGVYIKRNKRENEPTDIPLFTDNDTFSKHAKIQIKQIKQEQAEYYRNLFVHKLPAKTGGDAHYLLLIDGKMHTVFALQLRQATKDGLNYFFQTYAVSVPSEKWYRFNRLFIRFMLSKDFKRDILNIHRYYKNIDLATFNGIKTVYLTNKHEVRLNRGLMKKIQKEEQKDGSYKLQYYADFNNKTYKQNIVEYLDEHNRIKRLKDGKDNGSRKRPVVSKSKHR